MTPILSKLMNFMQHRQLQRHWRDRDSFYCEQFQYTTVEELPQNLEATSRLVKRRDEDGRI
jgi:hypothetical protein